MLRYIAENEIEQILIDELIVQYYHDTHASIPLSNIMFVRNS